MTGRVVLPAKAPARCAAMPAAQMITPNPPARAPLAKSAAAAGTLSRLLLPPDAPLGHLKRADVPPRLEKAARNGGKLPVQALHLSAAPAPGEAVRIYLSDAFWGIACLQGDELAWRAQIPPEA